MQDRQLYPGCKLSLWGWDCLVEDAAHAMQAVSGEKPLATVPVATTRI